VIITALPLEYEAVLAHLTDPLPRVHESGTRAKFGTLPGLPWHIGLVRIGEGAVNAAALTERVISWLRPQVLFFVGIAGSLKKDIKLGDVVVGTKVYAIHGGKETPEGFNVRPDSWRPSHRLDQAAGDALGTRAHFKPIAAGDILLDSAADTVAEHLRAHYNDAAAIEMEGNGFAHAAHLSERVHALAIRGISDLANGRKGRADASGSQQRAAANAAAAVAILTELEPFANAVTQSPIPDHIDHIKIGENATFEDHVIGKDVQPGQTSTDAPTHVEIGKGGIFKGPVTGKRVGGQ
jgi:nucleoside phosphorylase